MPVWMDIRKKGKGLSLCLKRSTKMDRKEIPAWVTWALLALAIAMCTFGVIRGEWKDVMRKAVTICMECIGIG